MKLPQKLINWLDKIFYRTDGKQDYCSCSPDVLFGIDIGYCCKAHDEHYYHQDVSKEEADIQLRENIKVAFEEQGKKYTGVVIAWIYFNAVDKFAGEEW